MTEPLFVDTNVWVCAVDAADPAKRERALEVIAPTRGRELVLSTQVLTEFYAVVTRKLAVPVPASACLCGRAAYWRRGASASST